MRKKIRALIAATAIATGGVAVAAAPSVGASAADGCSATTTGTDYVNKRADGYCSGGYVGYIGTFEVHGTCRPSVFYAYHMTGSRQRIGSGNHSRTNLCVGVVYDVYVMRYGN